MERRNLGTKKTIRENNARGVAYNCIFLGDNVDIQGDDNVFFGKDVTVEGNRNAVMGKGGTVKGNNNRSISTTTKFEGYGNLCTAESKGGGGAPMTKMRVIEALKATSMAPARSMDRHPSVSGIRSIHNSGDSKEHPIMADMEITDNVRFIRSGGSRIKLKYAKNSDIKVSGTPCHLNIGGNDVYIPEEMAKEGIDIIDNCVFYKEDLYFDPNDVVPIPEPTKRKRADTEIVAKKCDNVVEKAETIGCDTLHEKEPVEKKEDEEEKQLCCICMDDIPDMAMLPCRHVCACEACAKMVAKCPICRKHIEKRIKLFFS